MRSRQRFLGISLSIPPDKLVPKNPFISALLVGTTQPQSQ
jgi:hypothetical protein